jgi:hypothetical protein
MHKTSTMAFWQFFARSFNLSQPPTAVTPTAALYLVLGRKRVETGLYGAGRNKIECKEL